MNKVILCIEIYYWKCYDKNTMIKDIKMPLNKQKNKYCKY